MTDPVTIGLTVGALGGVLLNQSQKPPKPKAPPVLDQKQPNNLAKKQKQSAIGAYGSLDTMLTGPQGLGSVSPVNKQYASLLGGGT